MKLRQIFQIAPGAKLAPARGVRSAVSFFLALLVLAFFGRNEFGNAVGLGFLLGGLFASFCDIGSSVRARVMAMSALTLGGPLVVALGRSLAAPWWLAVLSVFGMTLLVGLLPVYGLHAGLVGLLLTIVFVVALGIDGGPRTALPSALGFLLSGSLVVLLTLVSSLPDRLKHRANRLEAPARTPSWSLAALLAHLNVHSPLLSQALLRALGAGCAAALAWNLGVPFPQWAPIIVIVCVRTDQETSVLAALQNITGTTLGALLADLLIIGVQNALVMALVLVVIVFIAFSVKDLNYGLFTFFMTNLSLLLISLSMPGVSHVRLRIFSVLVGAGIALVIAFLSGWLAQQRPTLTRARQ